MTPLAYQDFLTDLTKRPLLNARNGFKYINIRWDMPPAASFFSTFSKRLLASVRGSDTVK
jgi:hypothetical protein